VEIPKSADLFFAPPTREQCQLRMAPKMDLRPGGVESSFQRGAGGSCTRCPEAVDEGIESELTTALERVLEHAPLVEALRRGQDLIEPAFRRRERGLERRQPVDKP